MKKEYKIGFLVASIIALSILVYPALVNTPKGYFVLNSLPTKTEFDITVMRIDGLNQGVSMNLCTAILFEQSGIVGIDLIQRKDPFTGAPAEEKVYFPAKELEEKIINQTIILETSNCGVLWIGDDAITEYLSTSYKMPFWATTF